MVSTPRKLVDIRRSKVKKCPKESMCRYAPQRADTQALVKPRNATQDGFGRVGVGSYSASQSKVESMKTGDGNYLG